MNIVEKVQEGEPVIKIDNAIWQAQIVTSNNANLIQLRHKPSGTDILRTPKTLLDLRAQPERYGMPLLFPLGRIAGGRYNWNGREYKYPVNDPDNNCNLHGLILGEPWDFNEVNESEDETVLTLSYTHDRSKNTFTGFSHEFKLILRYVFTSDAVIQKIELYNQSDAPMPFGLGFHSAFNLPDATGRLMVATGSEYYEISPETKVPTGQRLPLPEEFDYRHTGGSKPGQHPVGVLTAIKPLNGFRGAVIYHPNSTVTYEVDEAYKFWALWNDGGGKGFFCIEPLTCLSNAPNLDLPPSESGFQVLSPDQSWTGTARILVGY